MSKSSDPTKIVSVTKFVPASAQEIFDLLADPRKHPLIDGSGTVKETKVGAPNRLALGTEFGMKMKFMIPYRVKNTVVEFEEGGQIAWRHLGGHIWRYILKPIEGGTEVTEQFDMNTSKQPAMLKLMKIQKRNQASMVKTLDNLVALFSK